MMIRSFYCLAFALATLSAACNVYTPDLLEPADAGEDAGDAGDAGGAGGAPEVDCPASLGCAEDDAGVCLSLDGIPCSVDGGTQ